MARPLLQPKETTTAFHSGAPATTCVLLLVAVFVAAVAVAAVVLSLCTSGKNASRPRKQRRSSLAPAPQEREQDNSGVRSKPQLLASLSGIGVKASAVAKMVSWNRRSPPAAAGGWSGGSDDDDGAEDEEALWKKTIIMGDKCRPLEFSGHIAAYDSDGNPLQPPTPAAAPAKQDAAAGAAAEA